MVSLLLADRRQHSDPFKADIREWVLLVLHRDAANIEPSK
jgi:hypothetical protein